VKPELKTFGQGKINSVCSRLLRRKLGDNYRIKDTIICLVGRSSDVKNGSAEQA